MEDNSIIWYDGGRANYDFLYWCGGLCSIEMEELVGLASGVSVYILWFDKDVNSQQSSSNLEGANQ